MSHVYGRDFTGKFTDEVDAVKAQWSREIAGTVPHPLEAIAWALKNLPERAPNAIQFRNLCRQAPSPQTQAMTENPAPVRGPTPAERDALLKLRDGIVFRAPGKQWAFDIVARWEGGDRRMSTYALRKAYEVVAGSAVPREAVSMPEQPVTPEQSNPWAAFYDEDAPC